MGRFHGGDKKEMGFPDEFGIDMCNGEQHSGAAKPNPGPVTPFCGYVTPTWFGPFLLSPLSRQERGWC